MLIAQVIKRGWYIDYKVRSIGDIPTRYIPFIEKIGEEKYGTDNMCYIILRLRRMGTSHFRGGTGLRTVGSEEEEATDSRINGGIGGSDFRPLRGSGAPLTDGRGGFLWWCGGKEDSVVSPLSTRWGRVYVVDQRQLIKLDIDVDVHFYDPNLILEKKLEMLRSLGYKEEDAWWEHSPSKKHIHILIVLTDPIPVKELFDLQFLLGDDPKRAEFNYLRYSVMGENAIHFNVLYKYKRSLTFSDKFKAILRHWFRSKQYSKKRKEGQIT